jgi:glycosyltransferase involved in cell wall biosynthesis
MTETLLQESEVAGTDRFDSNGVAPIQMDIMEDIKNQVAGAGARRDGWIPKDQRKKILLLSDDLRMPSGVGVMSREIVMGTAHRFNWIQVGAAINHPEAGKGIDISQPVEQEFGIKDPYVRIMPYNGYGDPQLLRFILKAEKPDAIMHFTDPRFWIWLYQMEHEFRDTTPLLFYHVWDDTPYPRYNENFYRSCDAIYGISKQTYNIVRQVWKKDEPKRWQVKYIPHGVDQNLWRRYTEKEDLDRVAELRRNMFGEDADKVKFVVLYNNRNIRRKMTGDVILAYRDFLLGLPEKDRDACRLVLHTAPVDEHGTDLYAVMRDVAPEIKAVFSPARLDPRSMVDIYNNCDVVINMASNEGFGIGTLEAIMAERMIIANVTGGLQDQMGFRDENDELINEDTHFGAEWGTNADGRYRKHGEWVVPLFPNNRALIGSPPTPYIFDDRCDYRDAAKAIREVYDMTPEERDRRGKLGREFAMGPGAMTSEEMNRRFMEAFEECFENWEPRDRVGIFKAE